MSKRETVTADCDVYWGSHGCYLPRGHEGHHRCECADDVCDCDFTDCCEKCPRDERCIHNVGAFPYYGPDTWFYGEDATDAERARV